MRNVSSCDGYCLYNVSVVRFRAPFIGLSCPVDNQPEPEAAMNVEASATTTHSLEGLECKTLQEIEENIDPRFPSLSRQTADEFDLDFTWQPSHMVQRVASRPESNDSKVKEMIQEPIYVGPFCIRCFVLSNPS